jgi:hypothetical protein
MFRWHDKYTNYREVLPPSAKKLFFLSFFFVYLRV